MSVIYTCYADLLRSACSDIYWQFFGSCQHIVSLKMLGLGESAVDAASKKIKKIFSILKFCLDELGVWLGLKVLISVCLLCF